MYDQVRTILHALASTELVAYAKHDTIQYE